MGQHSLRVPGCCKVIVVGIDYMVHHHCPWQIITGDKTKIFNSGQMLSSVQSLQEVHCSYRWKFLVAKNYLSLRAEE